MRVRVSLLGLLFVLAALAAQSTAAAVGAVAPTFGATDVTTCNGTSTVTVTIAGTEPPPAQRHLDVELVLDESGSVAGPDFTAMKNGAVTFANSLMNGNNALGVQMFSLNARQIFSLTTVKASAINAINAVSQRGGSTAIGLGLSAAQNDLNAHGRPGVQKVVILETDGFNNVQPDPTTVANSLKAQGTLVFTVGIGPGVDTAELNRLASVIPGVTTVYTNPNYSTLAATLETIAGQVEVPAATAVTYAATPGPDFTVTGATASKGTVSHTAGGVSWSLGTLGAETVTLTYTLQHTATTNGAAVPLHTAAALNWTDDGGAAQSASFADETVAVSGCNVAPTADAGPDQAVDLNGSPNANVTLDGSASQDDGNVSPLTYSWAEGGTEIATGASPSVSLGLGTHTITLTVNDGEFTATDDVVVTVTDPTAPVITEHVAGTAGTNGWYTSDVTVTFDVVDLESAATSTGCDPQTVSADTTGVSFTCAATSAGGTSSKTVDVKRDATKPSIVFTGNAGTYGLNDTVNITCAATDAPSGVAAGSVCQEAHGAAWTFGGSNTLHATATDQAGNTATASTTFTVNVTSAGLCSLIKQWVTGKGQQLGLCLHVEAIDIASAHNLTKARKALLDAFVLHLDGIVKQGRISAANAQILIGLSKGL
jgi:uncharacterized protein YegL